MLVLLFKHSMPTLVPVFILVLFLSYFSFIAQFDSGFMLLNVLTHRTIYRKIDINKQLKDIRTTKIGKHKHRTIMYIPVGEEICAYINIFKKHNQLKGVFTIWQPKRYSY